MNREQRRALAKRAQKHGMSKELAKTDAEIASGTGEHTKPQAFEEGDKIRLNIEAIKARKNYDRMSPMYKKFVEVAGDTVFTAHIERADMISLAEEPKWLFWSGDLIKVSESELEAVADEQEN